MALLTLLDGLLLFVVFFFLFLVALRFLAPWYIRMIFKRLSKKMEQEYGDSYQVFKKNAKRKPFRPTGTTTKKNEKTFGEYTDFEEID